MYMYYITPKVSTCLHECMFSVVWIQAPMLQCLVAAFCDRQCNNSAEAIFSAILPFLPIQKFPYFLDQSVSNCLFFYNQFIYDIVRYTQCSKFLLKYSHNSVFPVVLLQGAGNLTNFTAHLHVYMYI